MKRIPVIISLICLCLAPVRAQEKYSVVLEQAKGLSPYEAIYLLMDYQYWHPEYASIYYQLGNLTYDLLPTRDPLHHYRELSTLLYQSRLFYGNCLHFAKDQKLVGWQYAELANGQKRIEYAALDQFVRPRMEEIKRQQTACDSIHHSFVRMSERYNRCQALFTDFLNRYTRLKTAHLQLQPAETQLLHALAKSADSLEMDIHAYQQALTLQPIDGYAPVFRKEPVLLYRLDGLTHTDFLKNDIAIWDYSQWVQEFLNEQQTVYERLYSDLNREQQELTKQLDDYAAGQRISGRFDEALIGRCARLELQTPQVDAVRTMQERIRNCSAQQIIANSDEPKSIRELVPLLQIAATRRDAENDEAMQTMRADLINKAQPLRIQMQSTYTHPITGETIDYKPLETEHVYCLLPDNTDYRCVLTNDEGTVMVMSLSNERTMRRQLLRRDNEQPLVLTKIPGQLWVLITDRNIYWIP